MQALQDVKLGGYEVDRTCASSLAILNVQDREL